MKRTLYLFIALCFAIGQTMAQKISVDYILSQPPIEIPRFEVFTSDYKLFLEVDFSANVITNQRAFRDAPISRITDIDLVYTRYALSDNFDQRKLNTKRLDALRKLSPEIFATPTISWNLIAQTDCKSPAEGDSLFHGFVITYKRLQTADDIARETEIVTDVITSIDRIMEEVSKPYDTSLDSTEFEVPEITWRSYLDVIYPHAFYSYSSGRTDTVVMATFERNKHWQNALVVADLTGSMSPYYTQLLVWLKLKDNINTIKHIVFFNDGDAKETRQKAIGKTGGIYDAPGVDFDTIKKLATTTTTKGSGGDGPENDIEALLQGIDICPDCEQIVLIADNNADMRDYSLIGKIGKPVRVVMCGAYGVLNTQYLDLAKATGGSLHTIESDILDLMEVNEGQEVEIGDKKYKLENGKFIPVFGM